MAVSYIEPAERAWERTRLLLLRPFDVERWLVVGFAAFLASLAGEWAGISFTPSWRFDFPQDWNRLIEAPFEELLERVRESSWFLFGVPVALATLAVGLAFLWVSSRGKLIFVDNMVRGRSAFVAPWKRHGRLGNSLFIWRLVFSVGTTLVALLTLLPLFWIGRELGDAGSVGRPLGMLALFAAAIGSLTYGVVVGYVGLFLESFIVPLMFGRQLTAVEAWGVFLPLLRKHLPEFLVYGLVVLLGIAAVFLCLIAAAIMTCCILPLLLSVPYLRSVLLLPLTGFFRLYSVEFLAQFGPEYSLADGAGAPETPTVDEPETPGTTERLDPP